MILCPERTDLKFLSVEQREGCCRMECRVVPSVRQGMLLWVYMSKLYFFSVEQREGGCLMKYRVGPSVNEIRCCEEHLSPV